MNYTEWKQEYLELLIKLIKQHEYSKDYTQTYITELANELLERGGFFEDFNWWKEVSPKKASKESFKLWLADYFEEQTMDIQKVLEQHKIWVDSNGKEGERADLSDATLINLDLSGVDLRGAQLRDINLSGADLRNTNLSDADLTDANLRGAWLMGATLEHANLSETNLSNADLTDANLSSARLMGASLKCADLYGANLSGTNLIDADLSGTILNCADLKSADLMYSKLIGARLISADLSGADLRNTNLSGAHLTDANLRGADLREANFNQTILPKSTFIILGEYYFVSICGDCVRAGCQVYSASEWRQFSMHDISRMHGLRAIRFYPRLLDIIDFYCGKGERPEWLKERNNG